MRRHGLLLVILTCHGCIFDTGGVTAASREDGGARETAVVDGGASETAVVDGGARADALDAESGDLLPGPDTFSCGDSSLDTGEACDDGNTKAGDGCDASCLIEPGYVCPTPGQLCALATGVTLGASVNSIFVGGSGGGQKTSPCPAGMLLVGINAGWASAPGVYPLSLTKLAAVCRGLSVGTQGKIVWSAAPPQAALAMGKASPLVLIQGDYSPISCLADTFVRAADFYTTATKKYVVGISLTCAPLAVHDGKVAPGADKKTVVIGQTLGASSPVSCGKSPMSLAAGLAARAGEVVDAAALSCSAVTPTAL